MESQLHTNEGRKFIVKKYNICNWALVAWRYSNRRVGFIAYNWTEIGEGRKGTEVDM